MRRRKAGRGAQRAGRPCRYPLGRAGVSLSRATLIDKHMYMSSATTAAFSKVSPENWILGEDLLRPCPLRSATALLLLTTSSISTAPRAAELMGVFRPLLPSRVQTPVEYHSIHLQG